MAAVLIGAIGFAACSFEKKETEYLPPQVERYENPIEIEGQWGASAATGEDGQYGIGDPFVMRFNGKYYLYPSTSDPCSGIKVFESDDLIDWKDCGYAVSPNERTTLGAYAPEVVYFNGYFYLCQSRAGNGHYIYRSESPTGGFELISSSDRGADDIDYGNVGMGIDGSFYVSDEGRLYLLHTSTPAGLRYNEITDVQNVSPDTLGETGVLGEANLNHWIEGPGIFRRGPFSYLTYTGNHVLSSGYRVAYSYAENLSGLSSWIQPTDSVTIIDTDPAHRGLGHSSNFNGPDLDSVYTAYHSLVGRGPARRYNLDRYLASGSILTANGVTHRAVAVPDRPDGGGYADALQKTEVGYVLGSTSDYFTAEYNFVPRSGQELFFGADGGTRYAIRVEEGAISLTKTQGGKTSVLASRSVTVPAERLATVRVENGDGVGYVYFNSMRVLSYAAEAAAGQLGYAQDEGVGYTAFTDDVFGTSDFEALKNFPAKFPATSYLKGEMRGFSIADAERVAGGIRVGEKESTVRVGDAYAVALEKGDWVRYAIDVPADGAYALAAEVSADSAGAVIRITIGDRSVEQTVPASEGETVRFYLGELDVCAGVQTMKAEVVSGRAEITLFEALERDGQEASLSVYEQADGSVSAEGDFIAVRGERGALFWPGTDSVNFEATIGFSCSLSAGSDLGIMFRSSSYSYHADQPRESWRGYYLRFGESLVSLHRYDYGDGGALAAVRTGPVDLGSGVHTLTLRAEGNRFSVSVDGGKFALEAEDACAFMGGRLGVYAGSGEIVIRSFSFSEL